MPNRWGMSDAAYANTPGGGGGTYSSQAQQQLQGANQAGFFNPMGSPAINAGVRRQALRNSDNARRRSALLSRLMGLDPNQARVAQVNADTEQSGQTSGALQDAYLQQQLGNQNYFRGLFGQQLGNEQQRALAKWQAQQQQGTFGGALGGLVGQGAGAFLGGWGGGLGKRLGGG